MLGLGYQNPVFPYYSMRCHLPVSQQEFFVKNATDTQLRASYHEDEGFETMIKDTLFDLRRVMAFFEVV
ncbi:hypothetical protein MAP00_004098 [Monascus purpureus]|nr:hypothetical protein MAP00_004098 [Monascus purpureus]